MRYATWKLHWQPDERYGTGPEAQIGGAAGIVYTGPDPTDMIVGYIYSDHDLSGLEDWDVHEITGEQALAMVQDVEPEATLDGEGRIIFPDPKRSYLD
jgi:hypothetical protein